MDHGQKNSICAERELSAEAWYKKERSDICQEIETAQSYPRKFQSRFWFRDLPERPRNARGSMLEMMLRSPPPSFHSFFLCSCTISLSLSSSLCLSSGLVREPSHSQKTQNADDHVSRRQQSSPRKGPRKEREEGRSTCVCMRAVAPGGSLLIFLPLFVALCGGWTPRFRYFGTERRNNCPSIIR